VKRHGDALFAGAAMALAFAAGIVFLRLWQADLRVPLNYLGDGVLNLTVIKTAVDHGWYLENPDLGAPHGQELYDYPVVSGETLNLFLFWLAGLVTDDPALILNLFFLLTFPLAALTAFLVLRRLPVSRGTALVGSVLFTLLPYHFIRGEAHVFLAAYYAVPLGAYLVISVLRGEPLLGRWRRTLVTVALCIVVATASGSFYYSAFTVFLVAIAALLRFVAQRERKALVAGGAVVALITAASLVQLTPTIAYRVAHGANDEVAKRYWFESEVYGLKLTNLVLPIEHHRLDRLARFRDEYAQGVPQNEGRGASLGVVATAGFLWLLGVGLAACVGAARRPALRIHAGLAAVTLAAFAVATTGGLATLIGVVWPQIRAWNRISVFIAFFSLAAVALLLEALRRRISAIAFAAVLGAVLTIGVFDQTTAAYVPAYETVEAEYRSDREFVRSLEDRLPKQASVAQLPYEPFPEPSVPGRPPYDPAKPYLHSDDLRWSWGAMRGRSHDWAATIAGRPAAEVISAARRAGFAGILLDRLALQDAAPSVEEEFERVLGGASLRSPDRRFVFFEL
jgi:hypothetical protein